MSEVVTAFGDHVFLIHGDRSAQFPYCNGLLIKDDQTLLVDPGVGAQRLADVFERLNLQLDRLDLLLLTHYHYDHRGRAATIHRTSGCDVLAHVSDAPAIQDYDVFKQYTGITESPFEAEWDRWARSFLDLQVCPVTQMIKEGDRLRLGATEWQVLHTPGHTPGHVSLYEPNLRFLFAADVDLTRFGPWYGNIVSDIPAFRTSVQRLLDLATKTGPRNITITTGHRHGAVAQPIQAFTVYARHFDKRQERILALLRKPRRLDELTDSNIIYANHSFPIIRFFERIMLEKHLEELQSQDRIEQTSSGQWRRSTPATQGRTGQHSQRRLRSKTT